MKRRTLASIVVLLALALATAWFLSRGERAPVPEGVSGARPVARDLAAPVVDLARTPAPEVTEVAHTPARTSLVPAAHLPREELGADEPVLPGAASIAGSVRDVDGAPIEWAEAVVLCGDEQYVSEDHSVLCADDGSFLLENLPPGRVSVSAVHPERARAAPIELDLAPGQRANGVSLVLRVGGTIEGRVLDGRDRPVASALVEIWPEAPPRKTSQVSTETDGSFRFEHVDPGAVHVRVGLEARANRDSRQRDVEVVDGAVVRVELGGRPRGRILVSGVVRAAGPVSGADVSFSCYDVEPEDEPVTCGAQADADGHYELALPRAGRYSVVIEGYGLATLYATARITDAPATTLDFEFGSGCIAGRVVGPDGEPRIGASVRLRCVTRAEGAKVGSAVPIEDVDRDGRFRFDGNVPGTYEVRADPPSLQETKGLRFAPAHIEGIEITAGTRREDLELRLEAGADLRVRVVRADGSPAAGATVGWIGARRSDSTEADADGVAWIQGMSADALTVFAYTSDEREREPVRLTLAAGERHELEMSLAPAGRIVVRIVRADGAVLADEARVVDAKGRASLGWPDWDEDGRAVHVVLPGRHSVRAKFAEREVAVDVQVEAGGEREVVLREPD